MSNITTKESKVRKGNGNKVGRVAGTHVTQKKRMAENQKVSYSRGCSKSPNCLTCTVSDICQDCFEPVTSCKVCNVIRRCPSFRKE